MFALRDALPIWPRFNIDPAVGRARLPSLLFQPLVENAIKYAVTPQEEGADIAVEARKIGDRLVITVADTGPGADGQALRTGQSSTGVGRANIRERQAPDYGERGSESRRYEVGTAGSSAV